MTDERRSSFCGRMRIETPLGEERIEVIEGHHIIATRSKKVFQLFRWKGEEKLIKPDPHAPCLIDETIKQRLKLRRTGGCQGLCDKCRRQVKVEISIK